MTETLATDLLTELIGRLLDCSRHKRSHVDVSMVCLGAIEALTTLQQTVARLQANNEKLYESWGHEVKELEQTVARLEQERKELKAKQSHGFARERSAWENKDYWQNRAREAEQTCETLRAERDALKTEAVSDLTVSADIVRNRVAPSGSDSGQLQADLDAARAEIVEKQERITALEDFMNPQEVCDATAKLRAALNARE